MRSFPLRRAFLELYLLLCKVALDQGAHDLLGRFGGADVGNDEAAVGFLCVADPAWKEQNQPLKLTNKKQALYSAHFPQTPGLVPINNHFQPHFSTKSTGSVTPDSF